MSPTVDQTLSEAKKLAARGEYERARRVYEEVLERFPGNQQAIDGLAELQFRNTLNSVPNARSPEERFRHMEALYQQGQFQDVVMQGELLLGQFPNIPSILKLLGAANASLGNWEGAASHFGQVTELQPNDAESHNSLAIALSALGKPDEAIAGFKKTLELTPEHVEVHNNLGIAFSRLKRFEEAAASFQRAIALKPDYATAHNHLGIALNELGNPQEAIVSHEKALALNPDYAAAHNNLGVTLNGLGRFAEAAASHERALRLRPNFADAHNNLGAALSQLGRFAKAVASFQTALQLNPSYAEAYNNLGLAYTHAGRPEEAAGNFGKALKLRPDYAEAYYHQSRVKRHKHGDPQIQSMLNLLDAPVPSGLDRVYLNFALGNAFEHIGDYDKSFPCFVEGNRLRKEQLDSFALADRLLFEEIETAFSENLHGLEGSKTFENYEINRPIFIVGMPRSGTTLVEQILASHSQVHGAGELVLLEKSISLGDISSGQSVENQFPSVRNKYLSGLAAIGVPENYIADKNPLNFRFIGFILKAMPESKIIHMQRDARAVCWSIFKQFFPRFGMRQSYIYDLSELVEYYKQYCDLMKFWDDLFPGRIYNLNYELLTKHQSEETRSLLEFVGLDWEDQCLEFYKTERTVQSASSAQVRRKIYQGSSDQWRKYEAQLLPMVEALNGY